ncbi:MAG: SpoIIE family protein phosphatase [Actinobacteria bacterium]|nr:SpoIIE family protein phosphatase [Actinomycetota bacterium]
MPEPAATSQDAALDALDERSLLASLSDAIVVVDEAGTIVYVNPAAERMAQRPPGAMVGGPLIDLIPERYRTAHQQGFGHYLATGRPRFLGHGPVQLLLLRADGTELPVDLTLSAHETSRGRVIVGALRDLTDRIGLERQEATVRYMDVTRRIATQLALADTMLTMADAGEVVLPAIGEVLGWDVGVAWQIGPDGGEPVSGWSRPGLEAIVDDLAARALHTGEGMPGTVVASGEPVWFDDIAYDPRFVRRAVAERHGLRSAVAFPVHCGGEVEGVIELFVRRPRAIDTGAMVALAGVGTLVGQIIERERARAEVAAARADLLALARALQASLLPPMPPAIPGLEVATAYHAAGEGRVGGDFYDVFPLGDSRWVVAIGDARGRGPEAAALTALARHAIRAAAVGHRSPADMMRVVNQAIIGQGDDVEAFLSAAVVVLDIDHDGITLRVSSAGHPLPYLVGVPGCPEPAGDHGLLLGILATARFRDRRLRLAPGEALVLYTDGVTEARDATGEQFGDERLRALLAGRRGRTAAELVGAIEAAVLAHGGDAVHDDLAVVVLRAEQRDASGLPVAVDLDAPPRPFS